MMSHLNQIFILAFSSVSTDFYESHEVLIDERSHAMRMLMSFYNSLAIQFLTPIWLHIYL